VTAGLGSGGHRPVGDVAQRPHDGGGGPSGHAARDPAAHGRATDGDAGPGALDPSTREGLRPPRGCVARGRVPEQEAGDLDQEPKHGQRDPGQQATVHPEGDPDAARDHREADEEEESGTHLTTLGADRVPRAGLFGSSWAP
jgi:hypothetical protein